MPAFTFLNNSISILKIVSLKDYVLVFKIITMTTVREWLIYWELMG